jgi:predicted metal-dependent phosphotriesterase family hydrolase
MAAKQQLFHLNHRLLGVSPRTVGVEFRWEVSFEDRLHDQQVQSPSDEENARAIRQLVDAGFLNKILLSQDVFLKMMLTRYGGFGYAYVQRHFLPRLQRHGVTAEQCATMMVLNPRSVFFAA